MPEEYQEDDRTRTHIVLTKGTMVGHYRIVEKIGAGDLGYSQLAGMPDISQRRTGVGDSCPTSVTCWRSMSDCKRSPFVMGRS